MYGYIYKTTNLVNDKIYIGQKKSKKFKGNSYLGSGKRFKDAVQHYGKENFKVELIEEIDCLEKMDEREIYWISYYHATDKEIGYNISNGGNVNRAMSGEHNPFYGKHHTEETLNHLSKIRTGKKLRPRTKEEKEYMSNKMRGRAISQEARKKLSENAKHNSNYGMRGKHMSEEAKQKLRLAHLGKSKKSKGFIHITNDIEDKMINPSEFEIYEKQGWRRGRKKFSQEACKNISNGHKGHSSYNKNFIWITNGIEDRCIDKNELDNFDRSIWTRGRTNARGRKA